MMNCILEKCGTNNIEIISNVEELNNKENIIYKAYMVLKEKYQDITGVQVKLNKRIPMQAGLAGGSTNCASFILGMNKLFNLTLTKKEMESIGKNLGADVVSCFYNKALLAEGIGEIITPINTNFKYYIIIIKPQISCNTKEMYQKIDNKNNEKQAYNSNKIIQGLEQKKIELVANNLYNAFEDVIEEKELINMLKKELISKGAIRKFDDRFRLLCIWDISK